MIKILVLVIISATLSFASMASIFTGENIGKDEYKNGERGIIIDQDIDADGIIDSKDNCLDSIPCKEDECQKLADDDKDGVVNSIDECPNTPQGFEVDKVGCIVLIRLNVLFDTNKWDIKNNYNEKIEVFVSFMKKHPEYKAIIEGHTDSVGTVKKNQILSENRANNVKEYIISMGIDKERLESVGYGELNPINTNSTKDGRATNRRVIAVLKK